MLIIRRLNCIDAASGIVTLKKTVSGPGLLENNLLQLSKLYSSNPGPLIAMQQIIL